jgi:predicted  nucleic acid-binding Zn-ribbon protein
MRLKTLMEKAKKTIAPTKEDKKRDKWRGKLENARIAYSSVLSEVKKMQGIYEGTREVNGNPNTNVAAKDLAINVRNIAYELIESQVDSSIPMPKVTAIHEEDEQLARSIERALVNKVKLLKLSIINDKMERTVPVQGGDFFMVEWDNDLGFHSNYGDVNVLEVAPRQVIPQPGVSDIEEMDYIFVQTAQTKRYVKDKYGVDVEDASEEYKDIRGAEGNSSLDTDIVTVNTVYYKNDGKIGRFVWVDDYTLEDLDDYQARITRKCKECGYVTDEKTCPQCGSKKFEESVDEIQTISIPLMEEQGVDEMGNPVQISAAEEVQIEYYKPNCFPLIVRKNVSKSDSLLGFSDVKVIEDQQDLIKKVGSKAAEKTLKGGSIVTLPRGVKLETTDRELKIARLDDPQQKSMIDVLNMQVNIQQDMQMVNKAYEDARSTLGITDAFQGKYDPSAVSGTAKQYSINQAAGRLESKRVMKNDAYAKLYEMMFKFWLAYADDPLPITGSGVNGEQEFDLLDKSDFVKQDAAGTWYWNDEFLFETDPTSTMMANREAMWQQIDMKLQSGAFGQLGSLETMRLYWSLMEKNHYPNAGDVLSQIEMLMAQQQQMAQQQMPMEGVANEMPVM